VYPIPIKFIEEIKEGTIIMLNGFSAESEKEIITLITENSYVLDGSDLVPKYYVVKKYQTLTKPAIKNN
jgi:hypothetical protein